VIGSLQESHLSCFACTCCFLPLWWIKIYRYIYIICCCLFCRSYVSVCWNARTTGRQAELGHGRCFFRWRVAQVCETLDCFFSRKSSASSHRRPRRLLAECWHSGKGLCTIVFPSLAPCNVIAKTGQLSFRNLAADSEVGRWLRSTSSSSLTVRRTQLSTVGNRAFPVAAAHTWNSLPQHVTSAPSMSVFQGRLKAFLLQAFLSLTHYRNFCSACAVTVVIFGHLNPFFCLLTYYHHHVMLLRRLVYALYILLISLMS